MDINATVDALLACVCDSLDPPPCACYPTAGRPVADWCCDCPDTSGTGQLTVNVLSVAPVDPATLTALDGTDRCRGATLAAEVAVVLFRCHPTTDDRGRPPDPDDLAAAAAGLHDDIADLWQAVVCCETVTATVRRAEVATDPQGGCVAAVVYAAVLV